MNPFKVVVATVLTTLVVLALGVVAATALWPDRVEAHAMGAGHGYGHHGMHRAFASSGTNCGRLGGRHTQLLQAFVTIELGLDASQARRDASAESGIAENVHRALFQDAGADAGQDVLATLPFEKHALDAMVPEDLS